MFTKNKILIYVCVLAVIFVYILVLLLGTDGTATADKTVDEYKSAMTSLFWVGESSDASNNFIPNDASYWDAEWMERYGGVDDPEDRCGYRPCRFIPEENPFYFALPYGDRNEDGSVKESLKLVPWYQDIPPNQNVLKNRWIEVRYEDQICYAQWQDVGPLETDDFEYVFGDQGPKNTFGVAAGLDVSPAVWDCLGLETNSVTEWRFVEEAEVPPGPWKSIITDSGINF